SAAHASAQRGLIAAIVLLCGPLLLFYEAGVEIYSSELALVAVIVCASLAVLKRAISPYWLIAIFVVAALFKLSSTVFLAPLIAYALWTGAPDCWTRRNSLAL